MLTSSLDSDARTSSKDVDNVNKNWMAIVVEDTDEHKSPGKILDDLTWSVSESNNRQKNSYVKMKVN